MVSSMVGPQADQQDVDTMTVQKSSNGSYGHSVKSMDHWFNG